MIVSYEKNDLGEDVQVTTTAGGAVIRQLLRPLSAAAVQRAAIVAQLDAIDAASAKPRTTREVRLGNAAGLAYLKSLDDQAATLRAQLAGL